MDKGENNLFKTIDKIAFLFYNNKMRIDAFMKEN